MNATYLLRQWLVEPRHAPFARTFAALVLSASTLLTMTACGEQSGSGDASLSMASTPLSVTYQRGEDVMVAVRGQDPLVLIPGASYPRFSPDGRHVAAVRGRDIVVAPVDGGEARRIAGAESPRAVAWAPTGDRVFFTDGKLVRVVDVGSGEDRVVARGHTVLELDAGPNGSLVGTVKGFGYAIYRFDVETGEAIELADGCSASLSPDGARVTNLLDGHTQLELLAADDGRRVGILDAPAGVKYDNHMWTNHSDWIAGELEGERRDIVLIHAVDGRVKQVTADGAATRGDVFIHESGGT